MNVIAAAVKTVKPATLGDATAMWAVAAFLAVVGFLALRWKPSLQGGRRSAARAGYLGCVGLAVTLALLTTISALRNADWSG